MGAIKTQTTTSTAISLPTIVTIRSKFIKPIMTKAATGIATKGAINILRIARNYLRLVSYIPSSEF